MQTEPPSIFPHGSTTKTCGPNSPYSGTNGPCPSSIHFNTQHVSTPHLERSTYLLRTSNRLQAPKDLVTSPWASALPVSRLQRCQITDTAPNSLTDDAVSKPGLGPSSSSNDQELLLCSLQEPESNTGPLRIMTAIDVQCTSVSDAALALWAETSAINLKLFKTLKQRHQSLPHVAKHGCFPLSPWLTTIATSKVICAVDIRWNNRHLSHYFLIVPDLPHDIYIGADIMDRLKACINTVNDIIWAPLSHQLTTSVNLKNLQSCQTMPDACAMITEQEAKIHAYWKSVSVHLNM